MGRVADVLKREFLELLPTTIYFLVGFNIIVFSKHLVLLEQGIAFFGMREATIGALLVAKVVLVADKLPIVRWVEGPPPIVPILYRSILYTLLVFLAQILEIVIGGAIGEGRLTAGFAELRAEFTWEHFLSIYIWVFTLFAIYMTFAEIRAIYGAPPIWKVLIARGSRDA